MGENALASAIRRIAKETMEQDLPDIIGKALDKKIEDHLEVTVPSIVAAEIHRMLGDNPPPRTPGAPTRTAAKAKQAGPRKRCPQCGGVLKKQKDGTYRCKKHGEVLPKE